MAREAIYTLPQIAERAGAEYLTLRKWVERGIAEPSIHRAAGSGNQSLYSERDAEVICALAELRRRGIGMDGLTMAAVALKDQDEVPCPCCSTPLLLNDLQPEEQQEGEHRG